MRAFAGFSSCSLLGLHLEQPGQPGPEAELLSGARVVTEVFHNLGTFCSGENLEDFVDIRNSKIKC